MDFIISLDHYGPTLIILIRRHPPPHAYQNSSTPTPSNADLTLISHSGMHDETWSKVQNQSALEY